MDIFNLKLNYKKDGVPVLKDIQIREFADELISSYDETILKKFDEIPLIDILNYMKSKCGLKVTLKNLGERDGLTILGKTHFSKNHIYLDSDIENENRNSFRFTVAHEIGHWTLHRYKPIKISVKSILNETEDTDRAFLSKKMLETPSDWIEHHANEFAGSLLMPSSLLRNAVINCQQEMGITRRLGTILLDGQPSSRSDYAALSSMLQSIFGVSSSAMKVRLLRLGILVEKAKLKHFSKFDM